MKLSIITPTKNSEKYILETLQSIHGQRYPDLEHIIVDGCSTDNTVPVIRKFTEDNKSDNVRLVVKEDRNMYEAINRGLSGISGDIYAYLNSDDCYYDGAFKVVSNYFEKYQDVDMLYGNCEYVDENGSTLFWSNNPAFNFNRLVRVKTSFIQQPATFFRRRVLEKIGDFDTSYNLASDYEYLLRAGRVCRVMRVREVLVRFRIHSSSLTVSHADRIREEAEMISRRYASSAPSFIVRLQKMIDYVYIYSLLLRPKNREYMARKIISFLK